MHGPTLTSDVPVVDPHACHGCGHVDRLTRVWRVTPTRRATVPPAIGLPSAVHADLCDHCYEVETGTFAGCADHCALPLDHAGLCATPPSPTAPHGVVRGWTDGR